jgi:hypothetical protein
VTKKLKLILLLVFWLLINNLSYAAGAGAGSFNRLEDEEITSETSRISNHLPYDLREHATTFGAKLMRVYSSHHTMFDKEKGNPFAIYTFGVFNMDGLGCERNESEGNELIKIAGIQGFPPEKSPEPYTLTTQTQKLCELFDEESKAANPVAQFFLALCYQYGIGKTQDQDQAFRFLKASVNTGLYKRSIQYILSGLFEGSLNKDADFKKKCEFYNNFFESPTNSLRLIVEEYSTAPDYNFLELHRLESLLERLPGKKGNHFLLYEELTRRLEYLLEKARKAPLTRGFIATTMVELSLMAGGFGYIVHRALSDPTGSGTSTLIASGIAGSIGFVRSFGRIWQVLSHPIYSYLVCCGSRISLPLTWSTEQIHQESRLIALGLTLQNHEDYSLQREEDLTRNIKKIAARLVSNVEKKLKDFNKHPYTTSLSRIILADAT